MICLRQSRPKLTVLAAIFTVWTVVLGFFAFVSVHLDGLWPYAGLSVFAPLALAGAVATAITLLNLWTPSTITADASGFCFTSWRGERRTAWADVDAFIVMSATNLLRSPGCVMKSGPRKFISFGRNWQKNAEEIAELLENARVKL